MKNKKIFIGSYLCFWLIWLGVQTFLYSYLIKLPQFHSMYNLIINFAIKGIVWLALAFFLIHFFRTDLLVPKNKLFNRNFTKEFWIILVAFVIYLVGSAYTNNKGINLISHPFTTEGGQFLGITIGAGFFEELVFRAGYLNILSTKMKFFQANLIVTLMFLLIHFPIYFVSNMTSSDWIANILTVLVIGFLMGWMFQKSKNIWTTIILHCVWDTLTFLLII